MKAVLRLTRHSLRRIRGLMIASCVTLFLFQILLTLVARSFEMSGQFSELANFIPAFIRPLLDQSFLASLTFSGMVSVGYSHPILLILVIAQAIAAATETTGESESKFVDLLMARPLPRRALVARSLIVMSVLTTAAIGSMVIGTWTGLRFLAPEGAVAPTPRVVGSLAVNLSMLVLAWGSIAMAIGSWSKRRATAATVTAVLAFATFVFDFLGRLWDMLAPFGRLSPFHYYAPLPIVIGEPLDPINLVVLAGITVVASAVALRVYGVRDL